MIRNETPTPALRLTLVTVIIFGLFAALFSRLWFLQVLAGERYSQLAEDNRVRFVVTEAPRGRILDRHGNEIVKNRPALTVSADKRRLLDGAGQPRDDEAKAVLTRLSRVLDMPREKILERLNSRKYSPFRPVPIKVDVTPETVFTIEERKELFAGVTTQTLPVRTYPFGTLGAHVVGTIGEISEEELKEPEFKDYWPGDLIGQSGLEASYEEYLQGRKGRRRLEVNAQNTVQRVLETVEPVRGADVRTTLDLRIQRAAEKYLEEGILESRGKARSAGGTVQSTAGAVVVLQPKTGQVIAMSSYPTFDPSEYVGGLSEKYAEYLYDEESHRPLLNRTIQSAHPPGSTFKIVTAAAALESDMMSPYSTLPCPPVWKFGKRNWNTAHEGSMDIAEALKRSCDTVFYEIAYRAWLNERSTAGEGPEPRDVNQVVQNAAREFGLGQALGIDLPGEAAGTIPTWEWSYQRWVDNKDLWCEQAEEATPGTYYERLKEEYCLEGWRWSGGDAANLSIGQGDVTTTPLQIATAFGAVANDGTVWRPHVGLEAISPTGETIERFENDAIGQVALTEADMEEIQTGLVQVVSDRTYPSGTASTPFREFPIEEIPVAGKTGTAESGSGVPYAWFAAYAPADDPAFVVAVMVEEGGGGSVTAAPIAEKVLRAAFKLPDKDFEAGPSTD